MDEGKKPCKHEWSSWHYFCNQVGNGLMIKYCKKCGDAKVAPRQEN